MSAFVDEAIKKYFEYLETGGVEWKKF
jgi:hypothetical protein